MCGKVKEGEETMKYLKGKGVGTGHGIWGSLESGGEEVEDFETFWEEEVRMKLRGAAYLGNQFLTHARFRSNLQNDDNDTKDMSLQNSTTHSTQDNDMSVDSSIHSSLPPMGGTPILESLPPMGHSPLSDKASPLPATPKLIGIFEDNDQSTLGTKEQGAGNTIFTVVTSLHRREATSFTTSTANSLAALALALGLSTTNLSANLSRAKINEDEEDTDDSFVVNFKSFDTKRTLKSPPPNSRRRNTRPHT